MKVGIHICRAGLGASTRNAICALSVALLAASCLLAGQKSQQPSKAKSAGSFDKPIKKVIVHFLTTQIPGQPKVPLTVSCYYYPDLLVKQYHLQGDCGGSVSYVRSRGKLPACKRSHEPGEQFMDVYDGPDSGSDDFEGVKGNLVFSTGCENGTGGLYFIIYDSTTGKKVFDDYREPAAPDPQVFSTKAGVVIKYVRAANAGCDLHAPDTKEACWKKVKARLGVKSRQMPVCEKDYPYYLKMFNTRHLVSMIGYPVEVTLSPHPVIKAVAGPTDCWPTN